MVKNYKEVLYDNETFHTKNLILRKFKKEDAPDIFEYGSDSAVLEYLTWEGLKTIDDAKNSIADHYWSRPGIFAIELKSNKKCIGCIDFRINPAHEKAEFGYCLNKKYWGHGYMTEALHAVLELLFNKLEINRVEATYFTGNEGSGKVMAKCGMEFEGTGKAEMKIKNIFRDVVHYGITKERWFSFIGG